MGWFSNAYDNIGNAISDFDASKMLDDAVDTMISAKDSVVNATSSAIEWTVETGVPAVGNGAAWVVAATPVGYLARGAEAIGLGDPTGIADKHRQAEEAMIGFGKFVVNDPARAGAVLAQGASNAVTSTVGLVGDLVRNGAGLAIDTAHNLAWNSTLRPLINAGYSIGQKEGDPPAIEGTDFFAVTKAFNGGGGLDKAMKWTTGMNDITQFIEPIKGEYLADTRKTITDDTGNTIDNPDYMKEFEIVEGEEIPSYVKPVENPNANYERTILYGTQAIVEVPVFLVATAATGGAAGTIFALKWGGKGLQTVNAMKRADLVADAVKLTDKAAEISSKTGKAAEAVEDVAHTSKMAGANTEQAVDAVIDTVETTAKKTSTTGGANATAEKTVDTVVDTTEKTANASSTTAGSTTTGATNSTAGSTTSTVETSSKTSKLTAKADEMARGERLGTATETLTNWMKRKFPGVDDARQAMTQSDLMEYLAKNAEKLREAETKLDKLMSSGKATEKQILEHTKEIKAAEEVLEKSRISVNQLASSSGNSLKEVSAEAARSATKTTEDLGMADRLKRGWDVGKYKTAHFVDPSRSPIIDTAGVGLSFGMGVYADQKNAEAKQQSGFGIGAGEASRVLDAGDKVRSDLGRDTSWYKKYDNKANISQDFKGTQPNQNGAGADELPGGSIDRNGQSGAFNNRANGLVTPIDTPLFEVKVSQEAADALLQAIRK